MASSYAAVAFIPLLDELYSPLWAQEPNIVRRHIPGANRDDIQAAGRGNYTLTVTAYVTSSAGMTTLMSAVGITGRDLSLEGSSYNSVRLLQAGNPRRLGPLVGGANRWYLDLLFDRDGA